MPEPDLPDPVYNPGFTPARIYFLNDSIGFISDIGGYDVYATSDGGEHWRPVEEMLILGLHALNDSVSWLISDDYMLRTLDGGHTWETILKLGEFDLWNVSLSSIDENTGCAVGVDGHILKFSDNGEWNEIESGTTLPLNKVVFVDQKYGLITGGYSNEEDFRHILLLSEDGGDHWTEGPEIPYLIHDLQFISRWHGFAVGEDERGHGVLLETFDRGVSWDVLISGDDSLSVLRALYISDSTSWAVGDNSVILKYDATATWIKKDIITNSSNEFLFHTYPNPTSNLLTIDAEQQDHYSIEITSLNGQLLLSQEMKGTTHQLDLSSFQSGVYFITIRSKDFVTTRKIVKL
jgi:photosystem II stability/assembly factor-like uncharacterized protein